jgi:transcriptional regulator with XRE-family HTH domain
VLHGLVPCPGIRSGEITVAVSSTWYKMSFYPGIPDTFYRDEIASFGTTARPRTDYGSVSSRPQGAFVSQGTWTAFGRSAQDSWSATWYTWLEQGRSVHASIAVLTRIAEALQLSRAEKLYLFEIARSPGPDENERCESEAPTVIKDLVNQMPLPAYILDRQWNAVAWNRKAAMLFRPWLIESDDRNLLRFVFLNTHARVLIVDWRMRAKRLLAEFRSDAGRHLNESPTLRLISELQNGSKFFAKVWNEQDVREREGGTRTFRSTSGAVSTYSQVSLVPSVHTDLKFVALVPVSTRLAGKREEKS